MLEKQGSATLFSQSFILNNNGTRASDHETQRQADGSMVTSDSTWNYDALDRLVGEAVTTTAANGNYANLFAYDLANNRISLTHTGPGGEANETITSAYDANDELTQQLTSRNSRILA